MPSNAWPAGPQCVCRLRAVSGGSSRRALCPNKGRASVPRRLYIAGDCHLHLPRRPARGWSRGRSHAHRAPTPASGSAAASALPLARTRRPPPRHMRQPRGGCGCNAGSRARAPAARPTPSPLLASPQGGPLPRDLPATTGPRPSPFLEPSACSGARGRKRRRGRGEAATRPAPAAPRGGAGPAGPQRKATHRAGSAPLRSLTWVAFSHGLGREEERALLDERLVEAVELPVHDDVGEGSGCGNRVAEARAEAAPRKKAKRRPKGLRRAARQRTRQADSAAHYL